MLNALTNATQVDLELLISSTIVFWQFLTQEWSHWTYSIDSKIRQKPSILRHFRTRVLLRRSISSWLALDTKKKMEKSEFFLGENMWIVKQDVTISEICINSFYFTDPAALWNLSRMLGEVRSLRKIFLSLKIQSCRRFFKCCQCKGLLVYDVMSDIWETIIEEVWPKQMYDQDEI